MNNTSYRHQGCFYISAILAEENLVEVEAAIANHIHTIQQESVTEAEIKRIRTLVAKRFILLMRHQAIAQIYMVTIIH